VTRQLAIISLILWLLSQGAIVFGETTIESEYLPLQASTQGFVPRLVPDKALKAGALTKVDGNLLQLNHEHAAWQAYSGAAVMGVFKPSNSRMPMRGLNSIAVDATAQGNVQDLEDDLVSVGCAIISVHQRMVSASCPIEAIDKMAPLKSLNFVRPALFTTNGGMVTSQGDVAMRADITRTTYAVYGSGIVIGTLSDSYNCHGGAAANVASGDLPAGINVLDDTVCPATDEGRGLMQLISDVAPGARQAFHTGANGEADFANGIIELKTVAGSNVIVDDIIYFAEPMFQDGVIAQAVDSVKAAGVAYFSSAGNARRDSYEATFNPSRFTEAFYGGTLHDFNPGSGTDVYQTVTLRGGDLDTFFSFQWNEPYFKVSGSPGSASDYDIFICLDDTQPVNAANCPGFSVNANLGGDPIEVFGGTVSGGNLTAYLAISRFRGASNNLLKNVAFGGSAFSFNEWNTASASIYGHSNAAGTEAVGAVFYYNSPAFGTTTPILNGYSSTGGTPILFDTTGYPTSIFRRKPEISAPDGTNTTFFGNDIADPGDGSDFDAFPNLFGTSAAAPHAAGVAALMLEAVGGAGSLTPDEIYAGLESTAIDITRRSPEVFPPVDPGVNNLPVGFDLDSGYGLIQADAAVGSALLTPSTRPVDLSGSIKTSDGTGICAMVLASGQYMFSCNPVGGFSLTDLPRENDGTVKCQMYADGFFPEINLMTESGSAAVVMTRSGACPSYNIPYDPAFVPGSAGKHIYIAGQVLLQNSQTPICAMVLANGQHMFSCDGTGSYTLKIPLDSNGQFKLQVYADGFAPSIRKFDEFKTTNNVRMARAAECQ
jgi:hypothetical protein